MTYDDLPSVSFDSSLLCDTDCMLLKGTFQHFVNSFLTFNELQNLFIYGHSFACTICPLLNILLQAGGNDNRNWTHRCVYVYRCKLNTYTHTESCDVRTDINIKLKRTFSSGNIANQFTE